MKNESKSKLLKAMESIEELNCVLENWASDQERSKESFTAEELIAIASERLSDFADEFTTMNEGLRGDLGPEEKKYYMSQQKAIHGWLVKARRELRTASNGN